MPARRSQQWRCSSLQALRDALQRHGLTNEGLIVVATMLFSLLFFMLNTLLVSTVLRLKRNEPLKMSDWMSVFGWVGIAFAGSGAVAALLYLTFRQSGMGVLMAMLPIMAMLLATLHYYNRQQEAHEAMREAAARAEEQAAQAAAQAAAREAEVAALHLQELQASELRCRHRDGEEVWATVHCSFFSEPGSTAPCLSLPNCTRWDARWVRGFTCRCH